MTFVDVRSDGEWDGSNSRGNKRVGHVPGAIHVEWTNFLKEDKYQTFKSKDEIQKILDINAITPEQEIVTYWQGGIRAAHVYFVLKMMGYEKVKNYDGSMGEWANTDESPLTLD